MSLPILLRTISAYLFPSHIPGCHPGGLGRAMMSAFTSQKSGNATGLLWPKSQFTTDWQVTKEELLRSQLLFK